MVFIPAKLSAGPFCVEDLAQWTFHLRFFFFLDALLLYPFAQVSLYCSTAGCLKAQELLAIEKLKGLEAKSSPL